MLKKLTRIRKSVLAAIRGRPDNDDIKRTLPVIAAGSFFAEAWNGNTKSQDSAPSRTASTGGENPLRSHFDSHKTGRGIWKWEHYFDIYHRHFQKFIGKEVNVLEIGIYSGGSLEMWKNYFGTRCHIYGVDIEPACKAYEQERIHVSIGDQADRLFWKSFRSEVPAVDVLIDDGGHTPEQQITTLEEMLPHLRPGGVFMCEDVHGDNHEFAAYVSGMVYRMNSMIPKPGEQLAAAPTPFQRGVYSIHVYPFVVVIERTEAQSFQFTAPKHGTEWQPFFDKR